jgi:hypothetical protein
VYQTQALDKPSAMLAVGTRRRFIAGGFLLPAKRST